MPRSPRRPTAWLVCALFVVAVSSALAQPGSEATPDPTPSPAAGAPDAQDAPPDAPKVVLTPQAEIDAAAAAKAKSDALVAEGSRLYGSGNYKLAIERFREAYDLNPDPGLLYRIGLSYQQNRDWSSCVETMQQYLDRQPGRVDPQIDRARTVRDLCEARIERDQKLIVESQPPGARVFVDNRNTGARGQTPVEMFLRPGKHRVWVELDGYAPHMADIEVQPATPYRMTVTLAPQQDLGWLFVDASVKEARIYIDGRNVGLTPMAAPTQIEAGTHQIIVERDGYTRFNQQVVVERGQLARVDAYLVQTESPTTWRTTTGVVSLVLGAAAIAGGVVAYVFAEDEYNDTDDFDTLTTYQSLGYGVGGGLLAVGTSLLVWDMTREIIPSEQRNPDYGRPVQRPGGAAPVDPAAPGSPAGSPAAPAAPTTPAPAGPSAGLFFGPGGVVIRGTF